MFTTHCVVSEQIMIVKKTVKTVNGCKVMSLKLRASHDLVLFATVFLHNVDRQWCI